ncbi:MAG: hypothetical protein GXX82_13235 [Syntrophorhabdus sp.]|jgi:hypothetical protein|nr:hypothetical protein [Syntrophorhabdus sp.]
MTNLRKMLLVALTIACIFCTRAYGAEEPLFVFASLEQGREIVTTRDAYVREMSPFDRSCRMRTDADVTEETFLNFVSNNVLAWEEGDKELLRPVLAVMESKLREFAPFLPDRVYLVKTTGHEEGGAAYTRGKAIVVPRPMVGADRVTLCRLLSHELFHIMTRFDPRLRDELYETIGFRRCPSFEFPKTLKERKITNPDSPVNEHCISVKVGKRRLLVLPILYSRIERYDRAHSEQLFDYLQLAFLAVARDNGPGRKATPLAGARPDLYDESELGGFFEQVGKNTDYIIHPEEILADNFSYLFFGITEIESPEVVRRMERVFEKTRLRR